MQRIKTAVPMLCLCLLLSACGGTGTELQTALDFRTGLLEASQCAYTLQLTAHGEDEVFSFDLDCILTRDGVAEVTVLAPELLSGVKATISDAGAVVQYDGVQLDYGQVSGTVAPIAVPSLLYAAWTSGYISSAGMDGTQTQLTSLYTLGGTELRVDTWLDAAGMPCHCEVSEEGAVVVSAEILHFVSTKTAHNDAPDA